MKKAPEQSGAFCFADAVATFCVMGSIKKP